MKIFEPKQYEVNWLFRTLLSGKF